MSAATIAAIATPPGGGARGAIRISGPDAREVVTGLATGPERARVAERLEAGRGWLTTRIFDGSGEQPLLLLWMPGPQSYTREDVAELHLPGARPLLERALERVLELGAGPAGPGEFTRRAFANGRLDLTRAEAVLELIEARNEAERRSAGALLAGGLDARIGSLRDRFEDLRALCEASLDFDEADTGHVPTEALRELAAELEAELERSLAWEVARQPSSSLPRVVLAGAPNAGKSSLFNALVGSGEALVSAQPGSTRDANSGLWSLAEDAEVLLLDAPGLDATAAGVDAHAQALAARDREAADLVLWVVDAGAEPAGSAPLEWARLRAAVPAAVPIVALLSKADRDAPEGAFEAYADALAAAGGPPAARVVSAAAGTGLEPLREALRERFFGAGSSAGASATSDLAARHRSALAAARREVANARGQLEAGAPLDLIAETLRAATDALDPISGGTLPEDLLDRIFARFCIGK